MLYKIASLYEVSKIYHNHCSSSSSKDPYDIHWVPDLLAVFYVAVAAVIFAVPLVAAAPVVYLQVVDAVYTTLFFAFGQRASLQQQQQQLSRGGSWGLPSRGMPPHFAALRLSGAPYQEGGPLGGPGGPSAAEAEQQDIIWSLIPLGDAVELSVLVRLVVCCCFSSFCGCLN